MKNFKLICLMLLFFICFELTMLARPTLNNITELTNVFDYFYYTKYINNNIRETAEIFQNGTGYVIKCSSKNYQYVKNQLPSLLGEEINIENQDFSFDEILSIYNAKKVENIENIENSIFAYSEEIPYFYYIQNCKVNLQIFKTEKVVKIGFPILLGWI